MKDAEMQRVFKDLLTIDIVRGRDSTGVIKVNTAGKTEYLKLAMNAAAYLENSQCQKFIDRGWNRLLIGHNRAATKGAVNHLNAHPFHFGDIVGVHNGTLTAQYQLDDYDTDVDSERLYHHLATHGLQDTVNKMTGAWALVWYNIKDKTLNMYRNSQRPLHYAFTEDKKSIVFASEWGQLIWMEDKHKLTLDDIQELPVNQHMKIDMSKTNQVLSVGTSEVKPSPQPLTPRQTNQSHSRKNTATGSTGTGRTDKPVPYIADLFARGERVEFTPMKVMTNDYQQSFLYGITADEYGVPVKAYTQQRPELANYAGKKITLSGIISKSPSGGALFVSPHSVIEEIEEIDEADEGPSDLTSPTGYIINGVRFRDRADLEECLNRGCAWCSDTVILFEVNNPRTVPYFCDRFTYLCHVCKQEDEVRHYVQ